MIHNTSIMCVNNTVYPSTREGSNLFSRIQFIVRLDWFFLFLLIVVFAKMSGYGSNKPHPQLHLASKLNTTASAEGLLLFFYSALCSQNLDTRSQFWCHSLPSFTFTVLVAILSCLRLLYKFFPAHIVLLYTISEWYWCLFILVL